MKKRVLSGIRSTGQLHLGNYFGALRNFVKLQDEAECYFFIADYHSLTTHPDPTILHSNVRNILSEYLAAGIDPKKATIYVQSDVPEVAELSLLLGMHAYVGELERTASFKDKVRKNPNNVNIGLLNYPVLMASDILLHRADYVPVGKDQEQHLEMTRHLAHRFNQIYKTDFFNEKVAPFNFGKDLVKIPGLDGSGKMGKSEGEGNAIYLNDTPEDIRKKVMKAKTDGGPTEPNQEKPEAIKNLFQLMSIVSTPDTVAFFDEQYNKCAIRYGDMKKQLAEDMIKFVAPFSEKIKAISADDAYISKVTKMGAEKARESARKTIQEVREIIGFKPF